MKKILIVGAGFLQAFIIEKAKKLGYYSIAIDKDPQAPGFHLADEYALIDIIDQKACLNFAKSKNIDGVMTAATDYGVLSASYIAQQMNLPGIDYEIAELIKNKYRVRQKLFEKNIDDISQYYEIENINNVNQIKQSVLFPVMVKPCDGSGSKAVKRVDSIVELKEACKDAIQASITGKALIEDFVEGKEYGVESFVHNGKVHVLGVMEKQMTLPPDYAELGHILPSGIEMESKIETVAKEAIRALKISYGAVNMDVLVSNNKVYIIDIGARMGGNLIGSHIIPLGTGIDYMGILIKSAVGDEINLRPKSNKKIVVSKLLALKPGKIKSLPDFDLFRKKYNVQIYHHLKQGNTIRTYHNNLDGCGYVVATGLNKGDCLERVELVKNIIDKNIVREKSSAAQI